MKRYGKAKTAQLKIEARLTDDDRAEVEKFRSFLQDHKLPLSKVNMAYNTLALLRLN